MNRKLKDGGRRPRIGSHTRIAGASLASRQWSGGLPRSGAVYQTRKLICWNESGTRTGIFGRSPVQSNGRRGVSSQSHAAVLRKNCDSAETCARRASVPKGCPARGLGCVDNATKYSRALSRVTCAKLSTAWDGAYGYQRRGDDITPTWNAPHGRAARLGPHRTRPAHIP